MSIIFDHPTSEALEQIRMKLDKWAETEEISNVQFCGNYYSFTIKDVYYPDGKNFMMGYDGQENKIVVAVLEVRNSWPVSSSQ